jgi:hypothetical protein
MLALYAARIEDLGVGDFVKIDCAACHHVALLTPPPRRCPRRESSGFAAGAEALSRSEF